MPSTYDRLRATGAAGGAGWSRSIRTRFGVALTVLAALATLTIGALRWGARERGRTVDELRHALARHTALIDTRVALRDRAQRVKEDSDRLAANRVPVDIADGVPSRDALAAVRRQLAALAGSDRAWRRLHVRVDSLVASWDAFYALQATNPRAAVAEVVTTAQPLWRSLRSTDIPDAVAAERDRVDRASARLPRVDHTSSRVIWVMLLVSSVVGAGFACSIARDLLRAIRALKLGVDRFGVGDLAYRVTVDRCQELANVGESLNTMAGRLHQAREELEARNADLARLAFRDPLTTLANRALFGERVDRALAAGQRASHDVAVLFIDLDNFKGVNDTLGHAAGDRLLVDVAARLLDATRGSDTVARLGGDEFAILLERARTIEDAMIVAQRALAACEAPFSLDGKAVHVGISVGIALGRGADTAQELLRNADVAMYRAKALGKGRFEVFEPEMHTALLDRVELEEQLRRALNADALDVAFQPIIDLATGAVTGFEALARWTHPERGAVSPATFIPLAEDNGLILPIGRWVLTRACDEAVAWQRRERGEAAAVSVSVNVSGRQLDDPGFVADVARALTTSGLAPRCLTLEMTEGVLMRDRAASLARLSDLKALGVRVAVDDFGTGYSSLAHLQRFPVDVLKIDKAFVDAVALGGAGAALARTVVMLGETLGLHTVAEGVERPEQRDELAALGCRAGQGYLFARPLSAGAAREFLDASRERVATSCDAPEAEGAMLAGVA